LLGEANKHSQQAGVVSYGESTKIMEKGKSME
jgi:hypothetical protein